VAQGVRVSAGSLSREAGGRRRRPALWTWRTWPGRLRDGRPPALDGAITGAADTGPVPEGPSIVILREEAAGFAGRKVLRVHGNSSAPIQRMAGQRVRALRSWGKHFLVEFGDFSLRIHLLLFGSYRINERKDVAPRVGLDFGSGKELNFYACSVKFIEGPLDAVYDWSADVMNDAWDPAQARRKLRAQPQALAADALLDQQVFAGVGNIIKNEVLHRIRLHPESPVGALPPRKLGELVAQAREYSFDFLRWKRDFVLRKHFQVHARTVCPRDGHRLAYRKHLGLAQRRAFFCEHCQRLYPRD
jgi:endonuclease VIII